MPYIPESERKIIDVDLASLGLFIKTKGQFNYVITKLMHLFIHRYSEKHAGFEYNGPCYNALNDAVGILESVKAELQRSVIGPYEEQKKQANGSITLLDKNYENRQNDNKEIG